MVEINYFCWNFCLNEFLHLFVNLTVMMAVKRTKLRQKSLAFLRFLSCRWLPGTWPNLRTDSLMWLGRSGPRECSTSQFVEYIATFVILVIRDFECFFDEFTNKNFGDSCDSYAHVLMHRTWSCHGHESLDLVFLEATSSVHLVSTVDKFKFKVDGLWLAYWSAPQKSCLSVW